MGWTGTYNCRYKGGKIDRKATIRAQFFDGSWHGYELVADSMVGTTYYAAVKSPEGEVFPLIVLTRTERGRELIYKEMTDASGPGEYACPQKILRLLTPTNDEWANNWRKRCWEYHEEKKSPVTFANLPEGTAVRWTVPHDEFSGDVKKGDQFILVKDRLHPNRKGSKFVWRGRLFRIDPKWVKPEDYKILPGQNLETAEAS